LRKSVSVVGALSFETGGRNGTQELDDNSDEEEDESEIPGGRYKNDQQVVLLRKQITESGEQIHRGNQLLQRMAKERELHEYCLKSARAGFDALVNGTFDPPILELLPDWEPDDLNASPKAEQSKDSPTAGDASPSKTAPVSPKEKSRLLLHAPTQEVPRPKWSEVPKVEVALVRRVNKAAANSGGPSEASVSTVKDDLQSASTQIGFLTNQLNAEKMQQKTLSKNIKNLQKAWSGIIANDRSAPTTQGELKEQTTAAEAESEALSHEIIQVSGEIDLKSQVLLSLKAKEERRDLKEQERIRREEAEVQRVLDEAAAEKQRELEEELEKKEQKRERKRLAEASRAAAEELAKAAPALLQPSAKLPQVAAAAELSRRRPSTQEKPVEETKSSTAAEDGQAEAPDTEGKVQEGQPAAVAPQLATEGLSELVHRQAEYEKMKSGYQGISAEIKKVKGLLRKSKAGGAAETMALQALQALLQDSQVLEKEIKAPPAYFELKRPAVQTKADVQLSRDRWNRDQKDFAAILKTAEQPAGPSFAQQPPPNSPRDMPSSKPAPAPTKEGDSTASRSPSQPPASSLTLRMRTAVAPVREARPTSQQDEKSLFQFKKEADSDLHDNLSRPDLDPPLHAGNNPVDRRRHSKESQNHVVKKAVKKAVAISRFAGVDRAGQAPIHHSDHSPEPPGGLAGHHVGGSSSSGEALPRRNPSLAPAAAQKDFPQLAPAAALPGFRGLLSRGASGTQAPTQPTEIQDVRPASRFNLIKAATSTVREAPPCEEEVPEEVPPPREERTVMSLFSRSMSNTFSVH
ncbi:unnamed protein product, partial [Polarella glacialis]